MAHVLRSLALPAELPARQREFVSGALSGASRHADQPPDLARQLWPRHSRQLAPQQGRARRSKRKKLVSLH